jgi:hypothetical protein
VFTCDAKCKYAAESNRDARGPQCCRDAAERREVSRYMRQHCDNNATTNTTVGAYMASDTNKQLKLTPSRVRTNSSTGMVIIPLGALGSTGAAKAGFMMAARKRRVAIAMRWSAWWRAWRARRAWRAWGCESLVRGRAGSLRRGEEERESRRVAKVRGDGRLK